MKRKKRGKTKDEWKKKASNSETDPAADSQSGSKPKERILIKFALALSFKQIYNVGVARVLKKGGARVRGGRGGAKVEGNINCKSAEAE